MADHRLAEHGFKRCLEMHRPLGKAARPAAEIAHAVDQIGICLRVLFGDIGSASFGQITVKASDAVIDLLPRGEPLLIVEIAGPQHIEACLPKKADGALPPVGMMIGGVQRHAFDIHLAKRLDHVVSRHVEWCLVGVRHSRAEILYSLNARAGGMNSVRPHLTADINPVIGHAMHEFLKKPEIPLTLVQPVAVVGNMKHAAVNPDRTRAMRRKSDGAASKS